MPSHCRRPLHTPTMYGYVHEHSCGEINNINYYNQLIRSHKSCAHVRQLRFKDADEKIMDQTFTPVLFCKVYGSGTSALKSHPNVCRAYTCAVLEVLRCEPSVS